MGDPNVVVELDDTHDDISFASTLAVNDSQANKRTPSGGAQDNQKLAKRPRWGNKAFEEITLGDVEHIVRKCNSLEQKLEASANVALQLKESQQREKELEKELTSVEPEIVSRAKAVVAKQLLAQMIYVYAWNDELKHKKGRSISAFVPNVSPELLKALGGVTAHHVHKRACWWFDKVPVKSIPAGTGKTEKPGGSGLVLGPDVTLKYFKTTCELQVIATYKFGNADKHKKGTPKGRGKKAASDTDAVAEESHEFSDDDSKNGEDADNGDHDEHLEEDVAPDNDDISPNIAESRDMPEQ